MAGVQTCQRFCLNGFGRLRRLCGNTRRPYLVLGVVVVGLYVSSLLLQRGTGKGNILRVVEGISNSDAKQSQSGNILPDSHLAPLSTNGSHLHIDLVDQMEQQLREMQKKIKLGKFRITVPAKASTSFLFRYRDLAALQAQRRERIRHVCQAKQLQQQRGRALPGETPYHEGWYGRKFLYAVMEVYETQNFFFCPVLKVGSTFFRRLFFALNYEKQISSPYDISINTALGKRARHPINLINPAPVRAGRRLRSIEDVDPRAPLPERLTLTWQQDKRFSDFLHRSGKVMFTRDPYTKLLSGFMDKLFAPNPYFWYNVGRYIVSKFRPNASAHSLRCGHDVTFPEFIRYVIDNERQDSKSRDTHFVPSYDQCKPCDFHYDIVGKIETFPADVSLVLAQLGHNLSQSTLDVWARESEADAIDDSITSAYVSWRRSITRCMTWKEANQRMWKKLQTRGILDKKESLPMENFEHYSSNFRAFGNKLRRHWQRFRTSGLQSRQKKEALSSAFSVIPLADLELVREYFSLDFDLFQYDSRPDLVFKATKTWDVFSLS